MARKIFFVLSAQGDWKVTEQGGVDHGTHANKEAAIDAAVALARANQPSSLRIQRGDGTFEDERTYRDDPFPPPG